MERSYVTIKFEFIDTFGNEYEQSSKVELCPTFGYDAPEAIGDKLNAFMRQCGYSCYDKDTVLMESITDEEAEMLSDYLVEMRRKNLEK